SDMTVMVKEPGRPARTIRPLLPSEGYLCQVETYLLPQLLIRAGAPADYGFYSYRTDTEKVSFRRDTLDHAGGGWTIRTRYRDDLEPQTAIYTENAELVRIDRGEESVWKPIEVRELFDLWHRKKLPVRELG
ncbi:MAG TPA: hypothetical protein VEJ18_12340, partial [Planctomycetota bacterium]|nr:hypothetical protein [Planctomycetota bacterium]